MPPRQFNLTEQKLLSKVYRPPNFKIALQSGYVMKWSAVSLNNELDLMMGMWNGVKKRKFDTHSVVDLEC